MSKNTELIEQSKKALDKIRPYLAEDGGDVEFVEITADNVLRIKLTGACGSCPISETTLKAGIEPMVKSETMGKIHTVEA